MAEGAKAVGKLLVDLQVRKSTADGAGARKFYTALTTPRPGWDKEIRDVVLKKKQPRKQFVQVKIEFHSIWSKKLSGITQPNTFIVGDEVQLKEYPLSVEGAIESFIERDL